ncbi:hypothetical protein D3C78_1780780 [compost metagenome]
MAGLRVTVGSSSRLFLKICDLMRNCRTSASLLILETMRLTTVSAKWVFSSTCLHTCGVHSNANCACTWRRTNAAPPILFNTIRSVSSRPLRSKRRSKPLAMTLA